jgi:quinol monooxygenase YgiN
VLMLHAVSVKGAPEKIRILEVYASRQAYEAHIQTAHFLKYKTLTTGMVRVAQPCRCGPHRAVSQMRNAR